jgi:O-acetyl-ADP-ribose deacetylase (regulator of RNase III)
MIVPICADITTLKVDAIVNAANRRLRPGGGVDGAIHRAAGPELEAACRAIGGCPTGDARVTQGFGLSARWVIHTVGPVWHGGGEGEESLLARCYTSALEAALGCGARSIAFPAISTGIYGFPRERAAAIALTAMRAYESRFVLLVACCFNEPDALLYRRLLGQPPA